MTLKCVSFIYLLICLAVPGLSCCTWDLCCDMHDLQLWYARFLATESELLLLACGIQFPNQRSNLSPLHWQCRVPDTRPPGKSLKCISFRMFLNFNNSAQNMQTHFRSLYKNPVITTNKNGIVDTQKFEKKEYKHTYQIKSSNLKGIK